MSTPRLIISKETGVLIQRIIENLFVMALKM